MFGGGMFSDPFFGDIGSQMRDMQAMHEQMMQGLVGFRSMHPMHPMQQAIGYQPPHPSRQPQQQLATLGFPVGLFGGGMFDQMNSMMSTPGAGGLTTGRWSTDGDPNSQFYSSSTVMSVSNTGGQPKVYQASTSTHQAPGGVREMRRVVRDSSTGVENVQHGRHIGERGHVVQRQRNLRTGDREENVEFINLDEEEAPEFDHEWHAKAPSVWQRGPGQQRAVADARSRLANTDPARYAPKRTQRGTTKTVRMDTSKPSRSHHGARK